MTEPAQDIQSLKDHIHDFWGVNDNTRDMVEYMTFGDGLAFLKHGTITLRQAYSFYKAGLIEIQRLAIEPYWDEFDVVELTPAFKAACLAYTVPREHPDPSIRDLYSEPNEDENLDRPDPDDFRGSEVFLMSETRLRSELKSRKLDWLIYRTPYRPEI